jgi:sec-independent protein translocase protein TatC
MDDKSLTLIEHLDEFRKRLIRSLVCVAVFFLPCAYLAHPSIAWMKKYFAPPGLKELVFLHPMDLFVLELKISFFMAVLLALPYIMWQIWCFVAPGLLDIERRLVKRFVFVSTALFLGGAAFALFVMFPALLKFCMEMGGSEIVPMLTVQSFISMAVYLMLGFGVMFQLPVVVFVLASTGVVPVEKMKAGRPYIIVGIFIVAAILTPPDVISQICMAVPALILFELSLLTASITAKRKKKRAAGAPLPSN